MTCIQSLPAVQPGNARPIPPPLIGSRTAPPAPQRGNPFQLVAEESEAYQEGRRQSLSEGPIASLADGDLIRYLAGRRAISSRRVQEQLPPSSLVELAQFSEEELALSLGLTPSAARRIAAALELHRRLMEAKRPVRPTLRNPEEVASYLRSHADLDHERLWCLPLDVRSRLIGQPLVISIGDIDGTDAGPRAFFRRALRVGGASAIVVHNHPTGDPSPSAADQAVTRNLAKAGRLLNVELVDHVILGAAGAYRSLRRDQPELFS